MFPLRKIHLFMPSLIVMLTVAACEKDPEVGGPAAPDPYPVATTPEILMENFVRAYSSRDLEAYASLLHEDFIFSFQACDVERLGLSKDHYSRQDELETAANMFAGKDHVKTSGAVIPGITAIAFQLFDPEEPWSPAGDSAAAAGAMRASYQVQVRFSRTDASALAVRGRSVFYAAPVSAGDPDGGEQKVWQLVGWVDLTQGCGS